MHTYQILVFAIWSVMALAITAGVVGLIRAIRRR
jgi:hypothetical protein